MGFGFCKIPEIDRINESNTDHAAFISESASDFLYNSIVKINMKNGLEGTGFFMKIKINEKQINCLFTCNHVINDDNIDLKETIKITYGKINQETNLKIKLDINQRLIKTFLPPIDITLIEIIKSDNIPEDKYLFPDYNYKNGFNFYKNKNFYMAGYPRSEIGESERSISSGKIVKIGNMEFEHTLDSRSCSSGSPICLLDSKSVVGIHKQGNDIKKINYGTFIGSILDDLQTSKNINIKYNDEEHEFHFSNIKKIGKIETNEKIENIILVDDKYTTLKEKLIIVLSHPDDNTHIIISIYYLESKKLKFKFQIDHPKIDLEEINESFIFPDKLEIINHKYYKDLPVNTILLITKRCKILINLEKNKGKLIDSLYNSKDDNIIKFEYISNLDIFGLDCELSGTVYFLNQDLNIKIKHRKLIHFYLSIKTCDVNDKFFILYFYCRNCSTTTVYDIKNNYNIIYQRSYCHCHFSIIDNKLLILPPSEGFDGLSPGFDGFAFFNLENLSERIFEDHTGFKGNEPIIIKKFKGEFYLMCTADHFDGSNLRKKNDWRIVKEIEGKLIKKEKLINNGILNDNLIFLNNNFILSWNYKGNIINILSY